MKLKAILLGLIFAESISPAFSQQQYSPGAVAESEVTSIAVDAGHLSEDAARIGQALQMLERQNADLKSQVDWWSKKENRAWVDGAH